MVTVKIYAKDNALPGNRDMITWIESKFDNLVGAGLRFSFKILDDSDIKKLTANGINKLPVMFLDGKPHTGSIEIQNSLQAYIRTSKSSSSNTLDPAEDRDVEQFRNWQLGEMSKERRDEDARDTSDDNTAETIKQRAAEAAEARAKRHQQENVRNKQRAATAPAAAQKNTASRPDNIVMPRLVDKDDILLARMLETT